MSTRRNDPLRKKCTYSEFFWSVFFRIWTEYGNLLYNSLYSPRMRENTVQKNPEYGHYLRSDRLLTTSDNLRSSINII